MDVKKNIIILFFPLKGEGNIIRLMEYGVIIKTLFKKPLYYSTNTRYDYLKHT